MTPPPLLLLAAARDPFEDWYNVSRLILADWMEEHEWPGAGEVRSLFYTVEKEFPGSGTGVMAGVLWTAPSGERQGVVVRGEETMQQFIRRRVLAHFANHVFLDEQGAPWAIDEGGVIRDASEELQHRLKRESAKMTRDIMHRVGRLLVPVDDDGNRGHVQADT